jgi:hypothetical protein
MEIARKINFNLHMLECRAFKCDGIFIQAYACQLSARQMPANRAKVGMTRWKGLWFGCAIQCTAFEWWPKTTARANLDSRSSRDLTRKHVDQTGVDPVGRHFSEASLGGKMGTHDRAWEGFKIVVLAQEPLQAMRLEQSIAAASPGAEVQLSSFETYDEAYQFCKEQKNVGFFFLHEKCGEASFNNVFRELAAQYSNFDADAYGVILHDGDSNSFAERSVGKNPQLLDYLSTTSILDRNQTFDTIRSVWDRYVEAFEKNVIPKALQNSILSVAEQSMGPSGIHFTSRLLTHLSSDVNISWLESVAIKWSPFLQAVRKDAPAVLKNQNLLNHFVELCDTAKPGDSNELLRFLSGDAPLTQKVVSLANHLEDHRKNGSLENELRLISTSSKPGAPKLIRHIAKNVDRILSFQTDAKNIAVNG